MTGKDEMPDTGMDTGSEDLPRGEQGEQPLDRDTLAILAELTTRDARRGRPAAEDSEDVAEAVSDDAPAESYRPERGPSRDENEPDDESRQ